MLIWLALLAAASLTFLPLGMFVRRIVTDSFQRLDIPRFPAGSPDHGELP